MQRGAFAAEAPPVPPPRIQSADHTRDTRGLPHLLLHPVEHAAAARIQQGLDDGLGHLTGDVQDRLPVVGRVDARCMAFHHCISPMQSQAAVPAATEGSRPRRVASSPCADMTQPLPAVHTPVPRPRRTHLSTRLSASRAALCSVVTALRRSPPLMLLSNSNASGVSSTPSLPQMKLMRS